MKSRSALCLAVAGLLAATGAQAHHSRAMFDLQKRVSMTGTVMRYDWAQPHVYVRVASNENGKEEVWVLETRSPGVLARTGWNFRSLAVGDKVDVVMAPLTDGRHGGLLITVKTPSGKLLSGEGRTAE